MLAYIIRRVLYAVPIIIGVNLITFGLFFFVNSPDDMARTVLGEKRVTRKRIDEWKMEHGYHLPRLFHGDNAPLKEDHIYEWRAVCERLASAGETEDPSLEKRIWTRLPPEACSAIVDVSKEMSSDPKKVKAKKEIVIAELNKLLDYTDLFRDGDFAPDELTQETKELLQKGRDSLSKRELHRLNRLFFENVFPEEIAKGLPLERSFGRLTQTIFWQKSIPLLKFQFGNSDFDGTSISRQIKTRMWPSLCITIPLFFVPIIFTISIAMLVAFYRGTYIDFSILLVCVFMMSVAGIFYIIGGQIVFAKYLKLFPISGYMPGVQGINFFFLPVLIGIITSLPGGIRYNRTLFLEEINKDYVRTARSKGIGEGKVLFKHALKNAMIPILTAEVLGIPFLIMGNLMLEQFFSIPGLGNYTIEALNQQDFAVIRSMVYLISVFNVAGLLMVDFSYTLVDPRIRFS